MPITLDDTNAIVTLARAAGGTVVYGAMGKVHLNGLTKANADYLWELLDTLEIGHGDVYLTDVETGAHTLTFSAPDDSDRL